MERPLQLLLQFLCQLAPLTHLVVQGRMNSVDMIPTAVVLPYVHIFFVNALPMRMSHAGMIIRRELLSQQHHLLLPVRQVCVLSCSTLHTALIFL